MATAAVHQPVFAAHQWPMCLVAPLAVPHIPARALRHRGAARRRLPSQTLVLLACCHEGAAAEVATLLCGRLRDVAALAAVCPAVAGALRNQPGRPGDSPTAASVREEAPDLCCSVLRFAVRAGRFPLEAAGVRRPLVAGASSDRADVVGFLVDRLGASADERDDHGATALHYAALGGCEHACGVLLRAGAALDASDRDGVRPLHLAAEAGHASTVATLVAAGADVDACDNDHNTALLLAAQSRHPGHTCAVLVAAGARPHRTNLAGRSALGMAKESGAVDLCRTLTQPPSADAAGDSGASPSRLARAMANARAENMGLRHLSKVR